MSNGYNQREDEEQKFSAPAQRRNRQPAEDYNTDSYYNKPNRSAMKKQAGQDEESEIMWPSQRA